MYNNADLSGPSLLQSGPHPTVLIPHAAKRGSKQFLSPDREKPAGRIDRHTVRTRRMGVGAVAAHGSGAIVLMARSTVPDSHREVF